MPDALSTADAALRLGVCRITVTKYLARDAARYGAWKEPRRRVPGRGWRQQARETWYMTAAGLEVLRADLAAGRARGSYRYEGRG